MKTLLYRPFAEVDSLSEEKMTAIGFQFTTLDLDLTKENWLRLYVAWKCSNTDENCKTKYPTLNCIGLSHGENRVDFEFTDLSAPYDQTEHGQLHKAGISVGIQTKFRNGRLIKDYPDYGYRFTEGVKYGALVWFSPKNWNNGKRGKALFHWAARRFRG
jgi:hypothetical protein